MTTTAPQLTPTARPLVTAVRIDGRLAGHIMAPGHKGRRTWTAQRLTPPAHDARRYGTGFAGEAGALRFALGLKATATLPEVARA